MMKAADVAPEIIERLRVIHGKDVAILPSADIGAIIDYIKPLRLNSETVGATYPRLIATKSNFLVPWTESIGATLACEWPDEIEPATLRVCLACRRRCTRRPLRVVEMRPAYRTGELLENAPGVAVTQHSGEGNANQKLAGYNRDFSYGAKMASVQAGVRKARALCTQRGETLTPLRQRVLEIVLKHQAPVKAYDILRELQREQEKAAPPTAYRALDFLVSVGVVHRIESLSAYVGCTHERPGHGGLFFVCDKCHRIIEQQDPKIDRLLAKMGEQAGFRVRSHEVEVHGTCEACS